MTDSLSLNLGRPTALRGNPYHGLVREGLLTLPNAATMPYPQPSGEHWQRGSTALIAHPNAPGITRTPEQAADDAAAGREWWTQAILSGNQLYGAELPGWIYIDPAGARWLVTTDLSSAHVSGGVCTVTLARFGVLGGEPETYTYNVTVPNMGQSTPQLTGITGTRLRRYHTSPTGNGAMFEVSVEYSQPFELFWRWRPVGWVEITLSGAGASCIPSVAVRKTRTQTLGTYVDQPTTLSVDNYYLNREPDGSHTVSQVPGGDIAATLATHNVVTSGEESGFSGWVVGMLYSAAGAVQELTLEHRAITTWSSAPLIYTGPTSIPEGQQFNGTFELEQSWTSTLSMTYRLGGAVLASDQLQITETSSETLTYVDTTATRDYSVQIDCTPGASFTTSSSGTPETVFMGGLYTYGFYSEVAPRVGRRLQQWWSGAGAPWRYLQPCPYRYSAQLYGSVNWFRPGQVDDGASSFHYPTPIAGPSGAITVPPLQIDKSGDPGTYDRLAYASLCPVTGAFARDTVPVCYV
ncbi:hypothetical protein [Stutzerimonas stutzeri]|uniref:hypothetical protein n=1 Tax=Stutzerimonas stutzeri TaxID=316 RepID=UPI001BCCC4CB|nr:hypothetical protein [Stutzerimonas stutzeri]